MARSRQRHCKKDVIERWALWRGRPGEREWGRRQIQGAVGQLLRHPAAAAHTP